MVQFAIIVAIVASWAVCALVLAGMGLLIRSFGARHALTTDDIFDSIWLGVAATVAGLQIWHFFLPINWRATLAVTAIGAAGVVAQRESLVQFARQAIRSPPWLIVILFLCVMWLANRATGPAESYDSGSYHVAGIRWASEYPIVPGLGNLLDMLALNNTIFLCHSLLETGFWHSRSNHLINPLLIATLMMQSCIGCARCVRPWLRPLPSDLFLATMLPLAISLAVGPDVSSPSTDVGAAITSIISLNCLIRLAWLHSRAPQRALLMTIAATTALAITLKLSAAVAAVLMMLVACGLAVTRDVASQRSPFAVLAVSCMPWLGLLAPWMSRGILLSGYPVFPSTAMALDVPWLMSKSHADEIRDYMQTCGFFWWLNVDPLLPPAMPLVEWAWTWFQKGIMREPLGVAVPASLSFSILAFGIWYHRRPLLMPNAIRGWRLPSTALALAPILGGLIFWASHAPSPRFGAWLLWASAGCTAMLALPRNKVVHKLRCAYVAVLLLIGVFAIAHRTAVWVRFSQSGGNDLALNPWTRSIWMPAGSDYGLHPYPTASLVQRRSRWGLTVTMPADGLQTWWAPLPATFNDITWLRLQREGDMHSGFIIDQGPLTDGSADEAHDKQP